MSFARTIQRLEEVLGAPFDPERGTIYQRYVSVPQQELVVAVRVDFDYLPEVVCLDLHVDIQAQMGLSVSQLATRCALIEIARNRALEAEQIIQERSWPKDEVSTYLEERARTI
jgi:hypothetical protein